MDQERDLYMLMLRRMMLIREFEENVKQLVQRGELVGMAHCYIGEEAVAVGACAALRDDDYITGNHRSHGHPISKGGDVRRAMAELLGKPPATARARAAPCTLPTSKSASSASPASSLRPYRSPSARLWAARCRATTAWSVRLLR